MCLTNIPIKINKDYKLYIVVAMGLIKNNYNYIYI